MKKIFSLLLSSFIILLACTQITLAQDEAFYNQDTYETVFESGSYKIGSTLDSGIYRIISNADYGMYVISSDANQQDVIDVSPVTTHSYIEVMDGNYLQLEGVYAVPAEEVKPIKIENNTIDTGTYLVGYDIPSGEYEVKQTNEDYAMYVVYGSSDKKDIVTVSPITNNAFLEVSDGQYLQLEGATITDDRLVSEERVEVPSSDDSNEYVKGELLAYMEEEDGHEYNEEELKETMEKYNINVLNTMFFKDIGVVEYIHEDESFELTLTTDRYKSTLNAYIMGLDVDRETWNSMLEVFEKVSGTIATDMGTNYTLTVIRPNNTDAVLIYRDEKLIENNMQSGDEFINQ